jgi:putative transposase
MRWFQTTYTARFNRRHRLSGHLFQGRYKAVVVDPEARGYFVTLSDYIHLNPVRARIISLQERLYDYPWSSYRWYATRAGRASWFERGWVLGELGLEDTRAGWRRYAERMRQRAVEELSGARRMETEESRRGWCLGGASFRERMLALLEATGEKFRRGKALDGAVRRSHDLEEAERLLRLGLEQFALKRSALAGLKRSDPRKIAIARLIRARTAVANEWIARELALGHVTSVNRYCSDKFEHDDLPRFTL